jgi:competence protein ComEC
MAVPYGAKVRVTDRLQEPENFGEFGYKSFLARQGVHSQMSQPTVKVTSEGHGNPIYYGIYAFKDKAQGTIKSLLPNSLAALLSGILMGNDNELSPDLDDAFRRTGMTHIISGLFVISAGFMSLPIYAPSPKEEVKSPIPTSLLFIFC